MTGEAPAQFGQRFGLTHPYVEFVYLPLLGPTATMLARRLGHLLDGATGTITVDLGELARDLGVGGISGAPIGQRSPLVRAWRRLVQTGIGREPAIGQWIVTITVAALDARRAQTLPSAARRAHDRATGTESP